MEIDERIYFEEEQRMNQKWVWLLIGIMGLSTVIILVVMLIDSDVSLTLVLGIMGFMLLLNTFAVMMFKATRLNLAITRKGIYCKISPNTAKPRFTSWDDVTSVKITKSPVTGVGHQKKYKYGEAFVMKMGQGIELVLKDGKKRFFSCVETNDFLKCVHKLELPVEVIKDERYG